MGVDLYRRMLVVRLLEERLYAMCKRGEAGDLHFSKGQEAISVGVCAALEPTDWMVTHHRTIAHQIAKGAELYPLVAEILGKATGTNGGRAGEMHIHDERIRHAFSFQLVGTCVPVACGLAWALKNHHKTREVVACFFGDAATSNGAVHEGLTIAAVHKLPLLLVCENNGRAGNVTSEHYMPVPDVATRAIGYGIHARTIDGNDVEAVRRNAEQALGYIRDRQRPVLLECMTERLCPHKMGQSDSRSKEALDEAAKSDPLNAMPPQERDAWEAEIVAELDEVFAKVALDPLPEFS